MINDWSPGRAHHREHHKNMNNTIIEMKPDNTHLIRISDTRYQQLKEIGETSPFQEANASSIISFLIDFYYTVELMCEEDMSYKEAAHRIMFGVGSDD